MLLTVDGNCVQAKRIDAPLIEKLERVGFRIDHEEKVYPMVPAGAASHEMLDEAWDNEWVEEGV